MTGEFDLIDAIIDALGTTATRDGVVVGPGDDAAVLAIPPNHELVVSTDTLVADRHYPDGACADAIGYRSLAVATSDLAAMGAEPAYATVALTSPDLAADWATRFASGLAQAARDFGMAIVGGNLARGPEAVTVTVFGHTPRGAAITRSGARPGHTLYVTGTLGGAGLALGDESLGECSLAALDPSSADPGSPLARYWKPQPRITVGTDLRGIASAAIDISDGLSSDLGHLCRASAVDCDVDLAGLPLCPGADPTAAAAAGDDYELVLAAPPELEDAVEDIARRTGVAITPICTAREGTGAGVRWFHDGTVVDMPAGFRHF